MEEAETEAVQVVGSEGCSGEQRAVEELVAAATEEARVARLEGAGVAVVGAVMGVAQEAVGSAEAETEVG
jgi:hypothetical protein